MKIFMDTANIEEIREGAALGIIDGVTTNPSLMAKEDGSYEDTLAEICDIVRGPVSAEVVADDAAEMLRQGREYAKISEHIVIKVPLVPEGMKAVCVFADEDIKTNVTLCFSANQGLLAAKAGATYISPFVGRIDDVGQDGMEVVRELVDIYETYALPTQVLAASIRHTSHVLEAAKAGADVATIPHGVLMQMFKHPLTDVGLAKFAADWEKVLAKQKANVRS